MSRPFTSLKSLITLFVICAFLSGAMIVWFWVQSNASWRTYQSTAYVAGMTAYNALQNGTTPAGNVIVTPLSLVDHAHAERGDFHQIANAPYPARVTNLPLSADPENLRTGAHLSLAIISPDLVYRVADLEYRNRQTAAETTGSIFRMVASYCSDPMMVAQFDDGPWVEIDGSSVWGCHVAPPDHRLISVMLAMLTIGIIITVSHNLSAHFTRFARQLRNRRRVGGPAKYTTQGPAELRDIVAAVNAYLETERSQLESRAAVLSGVSHDLGSPATRLRLRAALIEDMTLRKKLEADIDSMTGMIESVLSYTRAEMNTESPRPISLTALVQAISDNYQDMGRAVSFRHADDIVVQGGQSVFMSRQGQTIMSGERDIAVMGRPISIERAVCNLIDNALKYGRSAVVSLETTPTTATIVIEDEGSDSSAKDIEALMAPYKRGDNTATIEGYGLGLTIVATIASLHGGTLSFDDTSVGVAARFTIQRR